MHPAERTVVVIASHFRLSKMMPMTPRAKDTAKENNISNPPRIGRGLPHPGLSTQSATITAGVMANKIAEIFP